MIHRSKALLGALLTATALLGAGAYAQTGGSVWDSTQLPETKGADSEGMRPPIPTESGHPIRSKAAT
jgi:hypothetical protein